MNPRGKMKHPAAVSQKWHRQIDEKFLFEMIMNDKNKRIITKNEEKYFYIISLRNWTK